LLRRAVTDDPRLVTGQQGSPSPACQQLSRARTVCAGGSSGGGYQVKERYQVRASALLATCWVSFARARRAQGARQLRINRYGLTREKGPYPASPSPPPVPPWCVRMHLITCLLPSLYICVCICIRLV